MKFKLKNHTAELKDELSVRVDRGYKRMMMATSKLNVETGTVDIGAMDIDSIMKGQEYVLENLLISLKDKEGNEVKKPFEVLMELSAGEVEPLFDYVDKLIGAQSAKAKKDGSATASSSTKESK